MAFRRIASSVIACLALVVALPPTVAQAAVVVSPDVANLQVGSLPALPYVDARADRIVDGSRRVSIAGLQGTVIRLYKVSGGYVLGRKYGARHDLVFVSNGGSRSLLTTLWRPPSEFGMTPGLVVDHAGSRIVFNRTVSEGGTGSYRDTLVMSMPSRAILNRRTFSSWPTLMAMAEEQVLISLPMERLLWWTPGVSRVTVVSDNAAGMAADLTAGQYAAHQDDFSTLVVRGFPPATAPSFEVEVDQHLGSWSLDDSMVAGAGEVDETGDAMAHIVRRASDGEGILTVVHDGPPKITWETNSAVLILTSRFDDGDRIYQWIRCTLAGSCQRVGQPSSTPYGSLVVATRRNS